MTPKPDPTLICPSCGTAIKLTESLAAPLVAAAKAHYEKLLEEQEGRLTDKEEAILAQKAANEKRAKELERAAKNQTEEINRAVQQEVSKKLTLERERIAKQEEARARNHVDEELRAQREESETQRQRIESLTGRLAKAQAAETALRKKEQKLEDEKQELDLTIQRGIAEGRDKERAKARAEAQGEFELKVQERDTKISQLVSQIENLKRKAEQGSQQAQGEALELALEQQLRSQFPMDLIEPVPTGEFGGDVLQHVKDQTGQTCGKILWEFKRTRNWSDPWLAKLRSNKREAGADIAAIVSQAMPKDVIHFDHMEGVWVSSVACILPVATALRFSIIELSNTRRSAEGQESKAQLVYAYLTGPRFKHRVECIVEKFTELRNDLDKERKWMNKQWAKRDGELVSVLEATSGMYGDLQGIAGQSLTDIDAFQESKSLQLTT